MAIKLLIYCVVEVRVEAGETNYDGVNFHFEVIFENAISVAELASNVGVTFRKANPIHAALKQIKVGSKAVVVHPLDAIVVNYVVS